MKALSLAVGTALLTAGLLAPPSDAQTRSSNERVRRVVVYGNERCPRGRRGETVVCARRPDNERYRIPKALRDEPTGPESETWASRAESLEYVGRTGTQSCSTVGPGGFTGCWEQMMRNAREERRQAKRSRP